MKKSLSLKISIIYAVICVFFQFSYSEDVIVQSKWYLVSQAEHRTREEARQFCFNLQGDLIEVKSEIWLPTFRELLKKFNFTSKGKGTGQRVQAHIV